MAKILVVEDEQVINDLIVKHLALVGHTCLSAYEGLRALELLRTHEPDLVILDVMLPGLDGFDLVKLMGDVPVIFVTAKSNLCLVVCHKLIACARASYCIKRKLFTYCLKLHLP